MGLGTTWDAHLDIQVQLLPEVVVQGRHLALQGLILSRAVGQGLWSELGGLGWWICPSVQALLGAPCIRDGWVGTGSAEQHHYRAGLRQLHADVDELVLQRLLLVQQLLRVGGLAPKHLQLLVCPHQGTLQTLLRGTRGAAAVSILVQELLPPFSMGHECMGPRHEYIISPSPQMNTRKAGRAISLPSPLPCSGVYPQMHSALGHLVLQQHCAEPRAPRTFSARSCCTSLSCSRSTLFCSQSFPSSFCSRQEKEKGKGENPEMGCGMLQAPVRTDPCSTRAKRRNKSGLISL